MNPVRRTIAGVLWICLAISPCAARNKKLSPEKDPSQIGSRDVGKGVNFYSYGQEIAMGHEMAQEVERQSMLVEDPVVTEYVNRIGQNLARNSDAKVPFTIKVLDSDEVNAFALPGGFFFVNSGLILDADNEAELAGVMAHEIAHVAARHGTRQASRAQLANFMSIPLIFFGGGVGYAIQTAATALIPMGFLKFSRGFESEADMLGIEYMYHAGYDPTAFVDFFEKIESMEKTRPGAIAEMFSSHPMTQQRIAAAQKYIQADLPPREQYAINTSEFMDVKKRLAELEGKRVPEPGRNDPPVLRRRPEAPADDGQRPTLKRHD
jgi:predicted Zn-dependent protease